MSINKDLYRAKDITLGMNQEFDYRLKGFKIRKCHSTDRVEKGLFDGDIGTIQYGFTDGSKNMLQVKWDNGSFVALEIGNIDDGFALVDDKIDPMINFCTTCLEYGNKDSKNPFGVGEAFSCMDIGLGGKFTMCKECTMAWYDFHIKENIDGEFQNVEAERKMLKFLEVLQ